MKPVHLYLKNFMNHLESDIDCSLFDSALIVGKNKNNDRESNGLGKSTVFNAIEYVLFNAPPPKFTLDELVHNDEEKCQVIFIFETDAGAFKIDRVRGKKKSNVELYQLVDDKWESRSGKTSTDTDKTIAKDIVKINHKTFTYSVLFAQEDACGLASATPEARRSMLKEPLNLNKYSKYEKEVRELAKENKQEIEKYQAVIDSLGDPDTDVEATKLACQGAADVIKQLNKDIDNTKAAIQQKRILLSSLEAAISSGGANVLDKLSSICHNIKSIQANVDSLSASIQDAKLKKSATEAELVSDRRDLKLLKDIKSSLSSEGLRKLDDIKADLKKAKEAEVNGIKYIAKLEAQESELKEFLLPDSDDCLYCKQTITEEHREDCSKKITEDLEKVDSELKKYRPKLENVIKKKNAFEKEIEVLAEHTAKVDRTKSKIDSKEDDVGSKEKMIEQLNGMIENHISMHSKSNAEIKELKEQEAELEKLVDKALKEQNISKKIIGIKSEIAKMEDDVSSYASRVAEKSGLKGSLEEKLKSHSEDKKKLASVRKKADKIEKELKIHNRLIQAFSSSGIPSMIINTILDDLQVEANNLLSQIKPELELQFKIEKEKADGEQTETLEIVYRVHGRHRGHHQLSGAQKLVVALSLKLGLSQVIQHRLGVNLEFLALDEVDQSLDKASVDALVAVVKKLQSKFKVFVITHNDLLKGKFSHAIVVEGSIENGVNAKVATTW